MPLPSQLHMIYSSHIKTTARLIIIMLTTASPSIVNANHSDINARHYFEQAFATSVVLFDNDAITFGFYNLDPNGITNISNEDFGSENALNARNNIKAYSIPITILKNEKEDFSSKTFMRLSYLNNEFNLPWSPELKPDHYQEQTFDLLLGYQRNYSLNSHWSLRPELSAHLMRYENSLDYNSNFLAPARPFIDGITVNTSAWSAILEPRIEFRFTQIETWGYWYAMSAGHYFYGKSWGEANHGDVGNPEGHYYVNGLKAFWNLPETILIPTIYTSLNRVDIRGDAMAFFNTNHYYKAAFGVLFDTPYISTFVKNLGIGVNLNYGSSLNGISLTFYINQE